MKTDLIGVWSADALFAPGAQEDELLVFRSDGTGWVEWMNFVAHDIEFFEWSATSSGWVALASQKRFERDIRNLKRYVEVEKTFDVEHSAFIIKEVQTPLHSAIPQLELQLPGYRAGLYGLTEQNADVRLTPRILR